MFALVFALGACNLSSDTVVTVGVTTGLPGMSPLPLQGSTVSGEIYVLVDANRKIDAVEFYLDDLSGSGDPLKVDTEEPFDLVIDTTTLSDGQHTLTAITTVGSRKTKTLLNITFTVTNTPPPSNDPPVVDAGSDITIPLSTSASLTGSVSDDGMPNGQVITLWLAMGGPGVVTFEDSQRPSTNASFSQAGNYTLQLSASDGELANYDEITVTVEEDGQPPPTPGNQPPSVYAGPDQTITQPDSATLNGSATDDGLPGGALTVQWSKLAGPGTVVFANPNQSQTTATFGQAGSYTLQLSASDGDLSSSDQLNVTVTSDAPPPPSPGGDVTLPARAAFYYPWYPQTWTVNGQHVFYHPTLGYYSSDDQATVDQHIRDLDHAKVNVAIASWWGPNSQNEQTRIPLLLDRTQALGSPLKWSFYYEDEGFGDPSVATLQSDLAYLMSNYGDHPSLARVNGKPVIFVYNADDGSCEVADRWAQASNDAWYLVLKVFSGYRNCTNQPSSWHQYSPVVPADQQSGYSYAISAGFWRADEASPRLARDPARFIQNVADMVASGEPWQLIATYNEWGEGTAIESASEWGTSYLDALATDGAGTPPPPAPVTVSVSPSSASLVVNASTTFTASVTGDNGEGVTWSASGGTFSGSGLSVSYTAPGTAGTYVVTATSVADASKSDSASVTVSDTPPPPPPGGGSAVFGIAGDFGGRDDRAGLIMTDMLSRNLDAFFLLGDLSYNEITPETAWCDWVHSYLGSTYPMQVLVGNHEEQNGPDGYILNFTPCMPDRLNSNLGPGGYGVNYASDLGPVTVIAIAADLDVAGVHYDFTNASPERTWLTNTIANAQAEGDWVVVGMHKVCITIGNKSCEVGQDLAQLLIDKGVDLVVHGHDHDYQRSHSLAQIQPDSVPAGAIADNGSDGAYARDAGTVFVVAGTVGRSLTTCSHTDSEFGYFAAHHCGEEGADMKGYAVVTVDAAELGVAFAHVSGAAFSDTFAIR